MDEIKVIDTEGNERILEGEEREAFLADQEAMRASLEKAAAEAEAKRREARIAQLAADLGVSVETLKDKMAS